MFTWVYSDNWSYFQGQGTWETYRWRSWQRDHLKKKVSKLEKCKLDFGLEKEKGVHRKAGIFLIFSASSFQLLAVQDVLKGLLPTQSDRLPDHHEGGSCKYKLVTTTNGSWTRNPSKSPLITSTFPDNNHLVGFSYSETYS